MTLQQKESLKALIQEQLQTLNIQVHNLQSKSITIEKDCSLDALNKVDMYYEHQREYTLVEQAKERIVLLEKVVHKIDDESYGICEECEDEIAFARLELLPESDYCVECLNEMQR
jgi:DnaK suppressor protein